ncbi:MAG: PsbP-related protein [Bacteroidota bacterium]
MKKLFFIFIILVSITLISCKSKTSQDYFAEAEKMYRIKEYAESEKLLKKSIELDSCNIDALYFGAITTQNTENFLESEMYISKYELCGGDEIKLCKLAGDFYERIYTDKLKAISYYSRLLKLDNDTCMWINHLADLIYQTWTDEDAKDFLTKRRECLTSKTIGILNELETNYLTYKSEKGGFSLVYPESWITEERNPPDMFFWEAVDAETGVNINITVASDQNTSLSDWMNMIDSEIRKDGYEIQKSEIITLDSIDCSYFSSITRKNDLSIVINNYVLLKNGKAYMMNYTGREEYMPKYKWIEKKILNSFNLI